MLIRELENQNLINFTLTRSVNENENLTQYELILNELKSNDINIIIGILDLNTTLKLYCQIYKMNMFGDNYQWIILGSNMKYNLKNVIHDFNKNFNCTYDQLLTSLNGTLQTRVVEYSYEHSRKLFSTYTTKSLKKPLNHHTELQQQLADTYMQYYSKECLSSKRSCSHYSYYHAYAYDVLLTIFELIAKLISNNSFSCSSPLDFERDINWFKLINNIFNNISFNGVTVKFLLLLNHAIMIRLFL